jgi:hypothetical protein
MKKTMLTCETLDRFEKEYKTEQYNANQIAQIEFAAYVANMNRCGHPEWTDADVFADFLRVLEIDKIEIENKSTRTPEEITAADRLADYILTH